MEKSERSGGACKKEEIVYKELDNNEGLVAIEFGITLWGRRFVLIISKIQ